MKLQDASFPASFRNEEPAPAVCPSCGETLDAATTTEKGTEPPECGSISLCVYCGAVGIFTDERLIREPTEEELAAVFADQQTAKLITGLRAALTRNPFPRRKR